MYLMQGFENLFHAFPTMKGSETLNIFQDEVLGSFQIDVLSNVLEYVSTAFVISKTLLFPGAAEGLAWKSGTIAVSYTHLTLPTKA